MAIPEHIFLLTESSDAIFREIVEAVDDDEVAAMAMCASAENGAILSLLAQKGIVSQEEALTAIKQAREFVLSTVSQPQLTSDETN